MDLISQRVQSLTGTCQVPGDKSISHRALMLGSIAEGTTRVSGFLPSADCLATLHALTELGVAVQHDDRQLTVVGMGLHGLNPSRKPLDCGNSGTAIRLLTGLLCGQIFGSILTGDNSLCRRPMMRIAEPLRRMGVRIDLSANGTPPIQLHPAGALHAIKYHLPIASAQLKSCLLLAGLYAQGNTVLTGAIHTRDHTERMLTAFACPPKITREKIELSGGMSLCATELSIPGDLSSAAFVIVAACIVKNSDVLIKQVGINSTRDGVLQILRRMGANIEISREKFLGRECIADIRVRASRLKGIRIPSSLVSNAIDEFPVLSVAAACAQGETEFFDAQELRYKESDRIEAMARGLHTCGVDVQTKPDGMVIRGASELSGGRVDSHGDHRIAMAFAVAGLVAQQEITIRDCANIDTSFPDFISTAMHVGFCLERI